MKIKNKILLGIGSFSIATTAFVVPIVSNVEKNINEDKLNNLISKRVKSITNNNDIRPQDNEIIQRPNIGYVEKDNVDHRSVNQLLEYMYDNIAYISWDWNFMISMNLPTNLTPR